MGTDTAGPWIEVEDTGVGMSQTVLTNCLLDFGTSFWGSRLMHTELPGLDSKGYNAIGRYGIGFFSVFMWGDRVKIVTQRYDAAKTDTFVLEFQKGLSERPLLRKAAACEYVQDAGTRVRVWLKDESMAQQLLCGDRDGPPQSLAQRCVQVGPCLDVSVVTVENEQPPITVLSANDWMTIDNDALCLRLQLPPVWSWRKPGASTTSFRPPLTMITGDDGRVFGRAAIWPFPEKAEEEIESDFRGAVVVGGFHAESLRGIRGVLLGQPRTAARNMGIPMIHGVVLKRWATDEANRRLAEKHDAEVLERIAKVLVSLDIDVSKYPIARSKGGWVTGEQVSELAATLNTAFIVQDALYDIEVRDDGAFELHDSVFVVDVARPTLHYSDFEWPPENQREGWGDHQFYARTLVGAVIRALGKGWNCTVESIINTSNFSDDENPYSGVIGTRGDNPIRADSLDIIRRPSA